MRHAFLLLLLISGSVHASDWPCWRGPSGQGICTEKDLPTTWDKSGAQVRWKVQLPGQEGKNRQDQNQSSPILVKERVIVTLSYWPEGVDATRTQPEHHVVCFDLKDGAIRWNVTVAGPWKFSDLRGGYTAPTPASDGERIFVVFGSSVLASLDLDGKPLWRQELVPYDFDVALAASPVLSGEHVVLQLDGVRKSSRMVAFDRKTGEVRWERKRPELGFSHSTPTLARIAGKLQLLTAASNALQGIDPSDGSVLWHCEARGDTVSPVVGDGVVYVDSGRGGLGVAVDPTGMGNVTASHRKWKAERIPDGFSSPLVVGEYLLSGRHSPNMLSCRKLATGDMLYTERLPELSTSASPLACGDRIYFATAGKSYVVKAGPKLDIVAVNDLGDASSASPAAGQGCLVLRGRQYLYCLASKK